MRPNLPKVEEQFRAIGVQKLLMQALAIMEHQKEMNVREQDSSPEQMESLRGAIIHTENAIEEYKRS